MDHKLKPNRVSHVGTGIIVGFVLGTWAATIFGFQLGYGLSLGLSLGVVGGALVDIYQKRIEDKAKG
jgi:hypothetical protein